MPAVSSIGVTPNTNPITNPTVINVTTVNDGTTDSSSSSSSSSAAVTPTTITTVEGTNLGTGHGFYAGSTSNDTAILQFKTLVAGPAVVLSSDNQSITLGVNPSYVATANNSSSSNFTILDGGSY